MSPTRKQTQPLFHFSLAKIASLQPPPGSLLLLQGSHYRKKLEPLENQGYNREKTEEILGNRNGLGELFPGANIQSQMGLVFGKYALENKHNKYFKRGRGKNNF